MPKNIHDIEKTPIRLLIESRSAANKPQQTTPADNSQQPEKKEEIKKVTATELERPPQLKAYIKYPKYDFF